MNIRMIKTATWITLLLFLVGCGTATKEPELAHTLDCVISFEKNGVTYESSLYSPVLGSYYFTVTSPDAMNGMEVVVENGSVSYTFGELTYSLEATADHSLFQEIGGILEQSVRGEGVLWEQNQEQWVGKGKWETMSFTVAYNRNTNQPVCLKTDEGLSAEFIWK